MKLKILILHGPNLNLLGERETHLYGKLTLKGLNARLRKVFKDEGVSLKTFQSNSEGRLIDLLHRFRKWTDGVVINPAAYTHSSYAIRDAIVAIDRPTVEVHLSDIFSREDFRTISVIAPVCVKQISGLGWESYVKAIRFLQDKVFI